MKHSFSFLVATIIASISVAQTPLEVSSKIDAITVYPRGAQVERSATKSVTSGRQMFVFTGLASEMDAATINVSANSGITVLSVSNQVGKLKQSAKPKELRMLEDSLQDPAI